jgi:hypothetical protein
VAGGAGRGADIVAGVQPQQRVVAPDAVYDSSSDQWSAPVGGGLVLYAVVVEPATAIVLRLVVL